MVKSLINEAQFCSSVFYVMQNKRGLVLWRGGRIYFFSEGGGDVKESFGRATFMTKFSVNLTGFLFI